MTKVELDALLDRLLSEVRRRGDVRTGGLGNYSVEAAPIYELYQVVAQLTIHLIQVERKLNKKQRKK